MYCRICKSLLIPASLVALCRRIAIPIFLLVLPAVIAGSPAEAQDQLIGTYNINYRYNAAGDPPSGSPNDGNPYFNLDPIGPGPYFINADPGEYKVVVTGYGAAGPSVADIWSGDATSGIHLNTPGPGNIGDSLTFTHTYGQIALYYWDWYDYDNSDTISTTVNLFAVPEPGNMALLLGIGLTGTSLLMRRRQRSRR